MGVPRLRHRLHYDGLTAREIETLKTCALSSAEAAKVLCVSLAAVTLYRTNMYSKLGVHRAAEAVIIGLRDGIVSLEDFVCGSTRNSDSEREEFMRQGVADWITKSAPLDLIKILRNQSKCLQT
jgi:DNA-binding CsgD family transcriptional regulator